MQGYKEFEDVYYLEDLWRAANPTTVSNKFDLFSWLARLSPRMVIHISCSTNSLTVSWALWWSHQVFHELTCEYGGSEVEDTKIYNKIHTYIPFLASFPFEMTPNPYWYLPLAVVGLLLSLKYLRHSLNSSPVIRSVHFDIACWMDDGGVQMRGGRGTFLVRVAGK